MISFLIFPAALRKKQNLESYLVFFSNVSYTILSRSSTAVCTVLFYNGGKRESNCFLGKEKKHMNYTEAKQYLARHGQEHLLHFYDTLPPPQQESLLAQIA